MKRVLIIVQMMLFVFVASAQTLSVNAPSRVQNGENFRLTYTVSTQNASDFRVGGIPEGLELITGPYTSTQSSFQMVNGHTSSSSSITYTFILCANKNGTYTIPPAHVHANGKQIASQAVKITVSGSESSQGGSPRMHEEDDDVQQVRAAGSPIRDSDLFIKVSANKKHVYEQEPILLTYKVYTLVGLTQFEGNMPDLTGFHSQEVRQAQQKSLHVENVNGKNYRTGTWSQYVMYPQMTGKLEIPSITFEGTVVQKNRDVDPFEEFFNGGSGYIEVRRSIKAPGVTIQVDPLPAGKPADFSGGVGVFNISAQLNKSVVKANDPVTVRVVVGGNGNLKLIKQPVVHFPKDFDKYDPKVTDKTKLTVNGVEGNMIYDFLIVPRNQGTYTIPPVEFSYFDLNSKSYKTIKSQSFELKVEKGEGGTGNSADFMSEKNQDIHSIKTGKTDLVSADYIFFGSTLYWVLLLTLLCLFIILMVIFRKRAIDNADLVKMKGKKANKIATKRLKLASRLMAENRQNEFYDEVLRALWGYIGDKLNIPVTDLSQDNIAGKLEACDVDENTVNKFIEALNECEYERYAPGDSAGNMNKTYETAMEAITKIEGVMKKVRKGAKAVMLLLMVFLSVNVQALTKQQADAEYSKGNYQQAIKNYEQLLKDGKSADLYYNLGNSYYRTDNITRAVLNYERALLLSPSDDDIRFNLQMARSKTIDKITPESEMFFFAWYRSLVNLLGIDGWAVLAIVSMLLTLVLALVYLFSSNMLLRKVGFFGGVLFIVLFLFSNLFAFQQQRALRAHKGAIVTAPSAVVKKTPAANSADQGVIHEGTRVDITDDTMLDWKGVRLADGREGWIQTSVIEVI